MTATAISGRGGRDTYRVAVEVGLLLTTEELGLGSGLGSGLLPPPLLPPLELLAHWASGGGAVLSESMVTSGPRSGNMRSLPSMVEQPLPTLATNMAGRELMGSEAPRFFLEAPPLMVTTAQFMYISRLPTLLNQDQAKTASPEGVSAGMTKG